MAANTVAAGFSLRLLEQTLKGVRSGSVENLPLERVKLAIRGCAVPELLRYDDELWE